MSKSRYDSSGMFWQDVYSTGRQKYNRPRPATPDTGWLPPRELPNLAQEKELCIDVETRDEGLNANLGPGQYRGDGYIVGIGIGTRDRQWYIPIRHENSSLNLDENNVIRWARDLINGQKRSYFGAKLQYDLEWLATDGIHPIGNFHDIQIAEPLINENQFRFSLDAQANKYLGEGKVDEALYQWCSVAFGGKATRTDQGGNIWRAPPELVGPYGEADVRLPFEIFDIQREELEAQNLWGIYDIERRLIPLLVAMRQAGVPVDVDRADEVSSIMADKYREAQEALSHLVGFNMNVDTKDHLVRAFTNAGLAFNKTEKGNPSFPKKWLEAHPSELAKWIIQVRKWARAKGTFVDSYCIKYPINGIIHAEFNQLKGDGAGTVARFSSSNPNLQNIPKRDKELKQLVRTLFIPEHGCRWRRYDWSQIEYRLITHYGRGEAAEEARRKYNTDPSTDYHQMVMDMTGFDRPQAKNINFGVAYGMKAKTLSYHLGVTEQAAEAFLEIYDRNVPWVSDLYGFAARVARERGFIRTILGRRAHFNQWEARDWDTRMEDGPMPYKMALEKYGKSNIIRAETQKAMSRTIQGGAADINKKAMVDIWESGVCAETGVPHVTVHDELGFSDPQTKASEDGFREVKHMMETCVKLSVPLVAECEAGPNWGNVKPI